ncbi:MAG: nuclear transport factor 2 family protein [Thermoleophilaceae bacterium]
MSQENVEVVRTAIEAVNRRDLRALADASTDDLEIVSTLTAANLGGATHDGRDAWVSYFAAMDESWEDWRIEGFEVLDAGDDRVACLCRLVSRGQHSGVPVERAVGIAYQLLDGRMRRIRSYLDPAEALDAVGLRE